MLKASVIISFYNRIDYLKYVLAGFKRQSLRDFEIIIADDGSNAEVVEELEKLSTEISYPLIHVWHEDKGFRKNKILNRAITSSNTDYLIFIDGDCVPHREFVNEHFIYSSMGKCLTGRRVNLSQKVTEGLSVENIKDGYLENNKLKLIIDGLWGKSDNVERGFYIRNKFLRHILNKKKRGILGCNFSIHKKDILAINGFDERYELPSIGEDSDVQFRLELLKVEVVSLGNIAVQYHLYHKLQERPQKNLDLFAEIKKSAVFYTPFGINQ
jgi:glycosyltransferase involved in cell wall biosynthesis